MREILFRGKDWVLARYLEGFTGTVVVGNIFDNPELLEEQ